jgi:phenylacetate-CoA ligase
MNDVLKYYSKNNLLTNRKLKEVAALYELDKNKLLEKYNDAFVALVKSAMKNSAFYKKLYREHGIGIKDIKDLSDIRRLPVLTKNDIKNHVEDIYHGSKLFKSVGYTSGTTGSPMTIFRSPLNVVTEQAYLRHYRSIHGYKLGEPLLAIRGMLDRNTTHKFNKKSNILYISSPNINAGTIDFYYGLIKEFAPTAIEAFPSYLHHFCKELEKKDLHCHIPNAFTSSETLYGFQRESIETFLQTKIHDWYGNAERTILLAQDKNDSYYPLPLYSINEFGKDEIITTALNNIHFPFIRYKVEDRIAVEGDDLLENIVAPKILQIEGRSSETIDLKDGSIVGCIDHAFKGVNFLECAQVHQYGTDRPLEVKLVVDPKFGPDDLNIIATKMTNMIGKDMPFNFSYCTREDLTYSARNKFKLLVKHSKQGA